jgi:hypothetical protein
LLNYQSTILSIPEQALAEFEPSQIGTIVGTLMDASLPFLPSIPDAGITKHEGILGEREGYPDYKHSSGMRLELKLVFVDNPDIKMKRPPTAREPSARLTQKVTMKNVDPERDLLLLIAYRLEKNEQGTISPRIIEVGLFPVIELVKARDQRMIESGGRWFGNYETPTILSKNGKAKMKRGISLDTSRYGRKESEGQDFNEDTNFGKLKRIPYKPLQEFLKKYRRTSLF